MNTNFTADPIVDAVINKHISRSDRGMAHYGVSMSGNNLTFAEWVRHLQEELMDAALYAERAAAEQTARPVVDFYSYQQATAETAIYTSRVLYPALGLASEAGEVAGKVKKVLRDRGGVPTEADRDALKAELGDVLWYVARLAADLNIPLQEIAEANISKLRDRANRGVIQGSGDNR